MFKNIFKKSFEWYSVTRPHYIPNLYDFLSSVKYKRRYFDVHTTKVDRFPMIFKTSFSSPWKNESLTGLK